MGHFKHEEIVGPEATAPDVPREERATAELPADRRIDAGASDRPSTDGEDGLASAVASAAVTLMKENRSLAIFGAFAVGVFIGSLAKS